MTSLSIPVFSRELLSLYEGPKYAPKTLKKMRQVMGEIQMIEGISTTSDLTTLKVAEYVKSKGQDANPNTTNGLLDYLRTACNYAVEEGYLGKVPSFRRVRPRKRKPKRNRPLSYDEAALLLKRLRAGATDWEGRRLYALYALILLTGIRLNEALFARVEDLNLAERLLKIPERTKRLKTYESDRPVPLPQILAHVLEEWLPHVGATPWLFPGVKRLGPWTGGMRGRKPLDCLKLAAEAESIKDVTWHGLRHTFGSHAVLYFEQPLWVVQAVMGHTDLRTTQKYLHLGQPALLAESVREINYDLPD